MEHTSLHTENHSSGTKEIWVTFWILLGLTLVELMLGFWMIGMENQGFKHIIKGAIIILMLAKAFYIVGYFMHLKQEIKNLVMTIIVPLLLFVWFIIAFLADGNAYRNLRNNYDPYHKQQSITPAPAQQHEHGHDAKKPDGKE
jgi:cytochrome c oxidase subunit IV